MKKDYCKNVKVLRNFGKVKFSKKNSRKWYLGLKIVNEKLEKKFF